MSENCGKAMGRKVGTGLVTAPLVRRGIAAGSAGIVHELHVWVWLAGGDGCWLALDDGWNGGDTQGLLHHKLLRGRARGLEDGVNGFRADFPLPGKLLLRLVGLGGARERSGARFESTTRRNLRIVENSWLDLRRNRGRNWRKLEQRDSCRQWRATRPYPTREVRTVREWVVRFAIVDQMTTG